MKFPLDQLTLDETIFNLMSHCNAQTQLIERLSQLLTHAMDASEHDDDDWYVDSEKLFKSLRTLKNDHDLRRWNQENYEAQNKAGVYPAVKPNLPVVVRSNTVKHLAEQPMEPGVITKVEDQGNIVGLPGLQFDEALNMKANQVEKEFGGEMTEDELERMFKQKRNKVKKVQPKQLNEMTMDEIESLEKQQDNATDIYKIAARVKNLARGANAALTEQGEMLCNTYCHVMKAFYDFADKVPDRNTRAQLVNLIRSQENMPGTLIQAAGAGVKRTGPKK